MIRKKLFNNNNDNCNRIISVRASLLSKNGISVINQGPVYLKRLHQILYKLKATRIKFKKKANVKSQKSNSKLLQVVLNLTIHDSTLILMMNQSSF